MEDDSKWKSLECIDCGNISTIEFATGINDNRASVLLCNKCSNEWKNFYKIRGYLQEKELVDYFKKPHCNICKSCDELLMPRIYIRECASQVLCKKCVQNISEN